MSAEAVNLVINAFLSAQVRLPVSYAEPTANDDRTVNGIGSPWARQTQFNSQTTPAPVEVLPFDVTLGGSPHEIDMASAKIVGAESASEPASAEDMNGNKVFCILVDTNRDSGTNTGDIVVKPKADATGYKVYGDDGGTDGRIVLPPKSLNLFLVENSGLPDVVTAGVRVIQFSGTSGDKVRGVIVFEG